LQQKRTLSPL